MASSSSSSSRPPPLPSAAGGVGGYDLPVAGGGGALSDPFRDDNAAIVPMAPGAARPRTDSGNSVVSLYPEGRPRSRSGAREPGSGGIGGFIDNAQLTQLSAMLKAIDAGDRIIKGRLELFGCAPRRLTQAQQIELERVCPQALVDSPLGPMAEEGSQILLANLRALMSLLFVDYDCTRLVPEDFERCTDKHAVVNTINHSLAAVVDRVHSGFLPEFWQAVQDAINVVGCEVFAFRPTSGCFEPTDNSLMSFNYFFVDLNQAKILFIGSVTKSRESARGGMDSDSDIHLSQDSASVSQGRSSSDLGSSLQEGEFAFSDASDDGMMHD